MHRLLIPVFLLLTLLCLATVRPLPSPPPAPVRQHPYHDIDLSLVRRIACYSPEHREYYYGTVWAISKDTWVTAAHVVTRRGVCADADSLIPMVPVFVDGQHDIAIVHSSTGSATTFISYTCRGFVEGDRYESIGWRGGMTLAETHLIARGIAPTSIVGDNLRYLEGLIYHGMSGGPVMDDHNIAVGLNTATFELSTGQLTGQSYSRDLSETVLCPKGPPLHQAASSLW